ncbi:sporulation protein [Actinomadura sp. 21ATH]|uniref:sporulation protein n=1 Tax=Actinomadura sp. 21ATH TaxID=1735444 RepID=UPI0035C07FB9
MSYGQMAGGYGGGAPGVTVDTVLSEPNCRPGGVVAGKVHVVAGPQPAEIRHVTLALMPRMQNGYGGESAGPEVYRGALTRSFRLDPGQRRDLAFSIPLPYELPFTTVLGRELPGFTIGLCTEVDVKGAADPGDVDPISVEPLKSQQWVLAAIARLGFKIQNVAFEQSKLAGVPQQLPFFQEIRLAPPPRYQGRFGEIGLTFVASPRHMAFVLEADRRDGGGGDESFGRFQVEHPEAAETDWGAKIERWLGEAASRPRAQGSFHSPGAPPPAPGPGAGHHHTPPGGAPLPPPGGPATFPPPPPGPHGAPAPAAASYGGPAQYGQFPPPAPGPGQGPAHGPAHGPMTPMPPAPAGPPGPAPAPYPGQAPPPGAGQPYPPPPAHSPSYPPPPGHGAPQYPPPPGYHGPSHHGRPHHGAGWGAAAAVGGVAAAGVAGGMAAGAAVDAFGNVVGGAANVAGYAAGVPMGQFGDAVAGYAGNVAADAAGHVAGYAVNEAANAVASEAGGAVAEEAAGAVGEILGGLLGGLFG